MTRDLVVFGEDFGRHPSSTEHLIRRIAAVRRVLWINSIGMRHPRFTLGDVRRAAGKAKHLIVPRPQPTARSNPNLAAAAPPGLIVIAPHAIPAPGNALAFHLNRALLGRQVRTRMIEAGITKPILWLSLPSALPVVGVLGERALVYYCGDDFGALAGVDHTPVLAMEREVATRADLIIVCSDVLAQKFPAHKTIVVPHGVDFDLFAKPAPRAADLPNGRKIAGFYGSLPHWVDPALVARTAAELPDWLFVFIGGGTLFAPATAPTNTLFLGPRPHHVLPGYLQHWDVSLLPYRDGPALRAGYPLKLHEYLAAGTPIATIDFPALASYREVVTIAANSATFAVAVVAAGKDRARNPLRRAAVAAGTWDARAAEIAIALEAL